ncbi:ribosome recycling factor [Candidatus Gottesmanbacteria bacterium RIFCSPLOWO2_01_FULL_49_10]|uniref:Ribosome-recycling factor n=1 Tax=Candidatus Gottesmanbacteria bacterium RIFCSPLOWO2_01_FULL_49_10 TaxID=1798396 RepID=A0A1F6B194_9BACT|nr:MAG: ribosome recycling factor [Candidatus Gottesmanbacteria bacterium RIFCSPLOWO2_01_FULL_49_10]
MIDTLLNQARDRMKKAIEVTQTDLSSIRSGRATPSLVEHLTIAVYGGSQRLKLMELATITATDAKTLVLTPYDPSIIAEIEKGIQEANTGLTPVVDGEVIRITIPLLSEERRGEYIKLARVKLEGGRIMIRQARQDAMHQLKKSEDSSEISQDQQKQGEKMVQELTDEMIAEIDGMGERKEAELLQV